MLLCYQGEEVRERERREGEREREREREGDRLEKVTDKSVNNKRLFQRRRH